MEASGSSCSTSTTINRQVRRNASELFYVLHDSTLSLKVKLDQIKEVLDGDNVNVNFPDDRDGQNTLLHAAVSYGYVDIVKLLLEKGADISSKNKAGETPLSVAQAKVLPENEGVNVKKTAVTASLHEAVAKGDVKKVILLLAEKGADVNAENAAGETPLIVAQAKGLHEIVYLLKDVVAKNAADAASLRTAVIQGDVKNIQRLLNKGTDVSIKTPINGDTLLHTAVRSGFCGVVQLLVENGADVNAKNIAGKTPFQVALDTNPYKNVTAHSLQATTNFLINHKAEESSRNARGNSPLDLAAEQSAKSIVQLLLDNEADADIKSGGESKLDLVTEIGDQGIVKKLSDDAVAQQSFEGLAGDYSTLSYKTSGAKKSNHGTLYQFHLLLCFLLRVINNGYNYFLLGTEVDEAEQFDDLVFKYQCKQFATRKQLVLQAKHVANKKERININKLLSCHKKAPFSLLKYFKSYLTITDKHKEEEIDLALCTNIGLDFKTGFQLIENSQKWTFQEETKFCTEFFKEGKCFKLVTDETTISELDKTFVEMINDEKVKQVGCTHPEEIKEFMALDEVERKACWEMFLNKLIFIVQQPADQKMIKTEFNACVDSVILDNDLLFDSFNMQMHCWYMKAEGTYLNAERTQKIIANIITKIDQFSIGGMNRVYFDNLLAFRFSFDVGILHDLNRLISDHNIIHLISPMESKLTAILVAQAIKNSGTYEASDSFIYMCLDWFLVSDTQTKTIEAFQSPVNNNLLVINCLFKTSDVTGLGDELLKIVNCNPKKKIVLIAPEDHPFIEKFNGCKRHNVTSVFQDLTPESKGELLEASVTLQGQCVKLNQVIDKDDKDLLDLVPLEAFISDEGLVIGTEQDTSFGYDESFYIERSLNNRIAIKADLFQDIHQKKFKDHVAKTEAEFQQLCMQHHGANVHWIQEENGRFIWVKSEGELNALQVYIDHSYSQSCTEREFLKSVKDQGLVIISDLAGMGKSTVLSHISNQIKENSPGKLVFRVDLNNFSEVLKERSYIKPEKSSAVDFLCESLIKINTTLEKELLKRESKVVLLFDGFDEIGPNYADLVLNLIQDIKEDTNAQIWITTRPFMREKLENRLHQISCSLQPFSEKDQINFLIKYWKHMQEKDVDEDKLESYALALVTQLSASINDKEREFTGIPLQVRMIAESYVDDISGSSAPELGEHFCLVDLYEAFIEKKYNIYFEDKNNWKDNKIGVKEEQCKIKSSYKKIHQWYR